jgi:hypothetical protein
MVVKYAGDKGEIAEYASPLSIEYNYNRGRDTMRHG